MKIAVVGAGRVGTALAVLWRAAGHAIVVASHGSTTAEHHRRFLADAPLLPAPDAARASDVVAIAVPDSAIAEACADLADAGALSGVSTVLHLSGATRLAALGRARDCGAPTLALHPLQTFPDVGSAIARLPGSAMAVTADEDGTRAVGERLAADAGCRPFPLADEQKPLYHAAAVLASNYVVALTGEAEALFREAGVADALEVFLPLTRASLENAADLGPAAALTGPVVRGDAATVGENLEAIAARAPESVAAYVAMADVALRVSVRSGRLAGAAASAVGEVLDRWR